MPAGDYAGGHGFYRFMTFDEMCEFEVLYRAYLAARKGKRSKAATAQYEAVAMAATEKLSFILKTKHYIPSKFETFWVYEPKKRMVQAPAFVDKVVQHALVDNILYDLLTHSFIRDSYASQKERGIHDGLDRMAGFMREHFQQRKAKDEAARTAAGLPPRPVEEWDYADGWVLKCDVHHFFASIDHDIVKAKLRRKVADDKVYDLMCTYIDRTDGLPLGYQTSQLLALMYLDDFDHFVKETLGVRYYGRYMDDFFLMCEDKAHLQWCLRQIRAYMARLRLELNNKTGIFPLKNGIDFLGFHTYLTATGKVIRKLRRSSIQRMSRKIRKWRDAYKEGDVTREEIEASFQAWDAHAAHGNTWTLRQKMRKLKDEIYKEAPSNGQK